MSAKKSTPKKATPAKKPVAKKTITKVTKTTTKKPVAKKSTAKKEIQGQQFGRNIVLVIEGKKYSKAFAKAEERSSILEKVANYNASISIKKEKEIINIMLAGKSTEVERKEEVKKKTKPVAKPEVVDKKPTPEQLAEYKKILEENDYRVSKAVAYTPSSRRGEY